MRKVLSVTVVSLEGPFFLGGLSGFASDIAFIPVLIRNGRIQKKPRLVASNIQILKKLRFAKWNSMLCGYEILLDPQVAPTETSHKKISSINSIHCIVGRSEPENKGMTLYAHSFQAIPPIGKGVLDRIC